MTNAEPALCPTEAVLATPHESVQSGVGPGPEERD